MRATVAALALLFPSLALAGYVIHPAPSDPSPSAIVAQDDANQLVVLDRFGQGWIVQSSPTPWVRVPHNDPPVPLADLLFWNREIAVTTAGEFFHNNGGGQWFSDGFPPSVSGLAETAPPPAELRTVPNPTDAETRLEFTLPAPGRVVVRVFDASGRMVRELLEADLPAGGVSLPWDGRDDRGELVSAGAYFSRVELPGGTIAGRIVRK